MSKAVDGSNSSEKILEVSNAAVVNIKQFLKENNLSSIGLRIMAQRDDCGCIGYQIHLEESSDDDDTVVETDGLKILLDPDSVKLLRGTKMDFAETPDGGGFIFDNPNDQHMH
ncbi:MAG: iron-sulfur cluster assembly accessory protein [Thaumarchaeota archaeon]|nr:iron-sulfur cluster assembly accessory protein [Nitrososphaerota archaeon]MCL5317424.1 iron-sulfur cluster assembly accessory protein [Nitrososphaerota archaeon]